MHDVPPEPDPEPAPTVETSAPPTQPKTHTVQRGETLFSIAKRYGVSLEALIRANGIEDVTRIHAGNTLRVSRLDASAPPAASNAVGSSPAAHEAPSAPDPAHSSSGHERYVVRRGDFLTQIGA